MSFILTAGGVVLLLLAGTALVHGASALAARHGVPPMVVGLTVVAFGTSSPELVVNIVGALRGETDLAFGNIAGSNIANLGLVLGAAALVHPMTIQGQLVRRELPLLLLGTTVLLVLILDLPLLNQPPVLTIADGLVLLLLFSVFVYITVKDFVDQKHDALMTDIREIEGKLPSSPTSGTLALWGYIGFGIAGLALGGHMTITGGSSLAEALGVPPVIIGMFVIGVGTSLPELVTSIIAALNDESDLCVGNVVGSNLFNALVVLPVSTLFAPVAVPAGGVMDILVSLALCALLLPIFFFGNTRMNRTVGLTFVVIFLGYMVFRSLYSV